MLLFKVERITREHFRRLQISESLSYPCAKRISHLFITDPLISIQSISVCTPMVRFRTFKSSVCKLGSWSLFVMLRTVSIAYIGTVLERYVVLVPRKKGSCLWTLVLNVCAIWTISCFRASKKTYPWYVITSKNCRTVYWFNTWDEPE